MPYRGCCIWKTGYFLEVINRLKNEKIFVNVFVKSFFNFSTSKHSYKYIESSRLVERRIVVQKFQFPFFFSSIFSRLELKRHGRHTVYPPTFSFIVISIFTTSPLTVAGCTMQCVVNNKLNSFEHEKIGGLIRSLRRVESL